MKGIEDGTAGADGREIGWAPTPTPFGAVVERSGGSVACVVVLVVGTEKGRGGRMEGCCGKRVPARLESGSDGPP